MTMHLLAQINDDYCDCLSGRDEPGTSACSQQGANFTCSDGRQAMSTSFVQDGFRYEKIGGSGCLLASCTECR